MKKLLIAGLMAATFVTPTKAHQPGGVMGALGMLGLAGHIHDMAPLYVYESMGEQWATLGGGEKCDEVMSAPDGGATVKRLAQIHRKPEITMSCVDRQEIKRVLSQFLREKYKVGRATVYDYVMPRNTIKEVGGKLQLPE